MHVYMCPDNGYVDCQTGEVYYSWQVDTLVNHHGIDFYIHNSFDAYLNYMMESVSYPQPVTVVLSKE